MQSRNLNRAGARQRSPRQRRLMAAVTAVLMALPGLAHPISLSQLLRLPMEALLRLEVTGPTAGAALQRATSLALPAPPLGSPR